jgi:hypothetical protein
MSNEESIGDISNVCLFIYLFIYSYGMEPERYGLFLEREEKTKARRVDKGKKNKKTNRQHNK